MKTLSSALQLLLATDHFNMADLFTITLVTGTVLRLTTADIDIVSGGNTFSHVGPLITRSKITWTTGLETDELDINVLPGAMDSIEGYPFLSAVQNGVFDGAEVQLERAFMSTWGDTSAGTVVLFAGRVAGIDAYRTIANVKINSYKELLNIQLPRNLYGSACSLVLYDNQCTVSEASYTFTGTVGSGATRTSIPVSGVSKPDGYFAQGILVLKAGLVRRMVKTWSSSVVVPNYPLPAAPGSGDAVKLVAGCDQTLTTCTNRFANQNHFKGYPYIPEATTAL